MATDVKKVLQENSQLSNTKNKMTSQSFLTRFVQKDERKTLATIQYKDRNKLSKDALINVQKEKANKKRSKEFDLNNGKSVNIYVDPYLRGDKTFDNKAVQTEGRSQEEQKSAEEEAYDLMVNDEIPESYWKELAEQRRQALDDSLHENEQLHKEIDELKEENEKLSHMAGQADYFAGVIQTLLVDNDDKDADSPEHKTDEDSLEAKTQVSEDEDSDKEETDENSDHLNKEMVKESVPIKDEAETSEEENTYL